MKNILSLLIIVFCLVFSGCGNKEEENKSSNKDSNNKTQTQQQTSDQSKFNSSNPEVTKIWNQIEQINSSMGNGINAGKSGHLEEPVSEIISYLKMIPEKAPDISSENLETLKIKVIELRKTGVIMDKLQHANNTSELKEEYIKFSQTLNEIKNILPE
jgi:hypothetical protein